MIDREVRHELERVQAENQKLKARLRRFEGLDPDALGAENARLARSLDRATEQRDQLQRELGAARVEAERLRRSLDAARSQLAKGKRTQGTLARLLTLRRPAKD